MSVTVIERTETDNGNHEVLQRRQRGTTQMRVTAYNTIGTKDNNRVVVSYDVETENVREALQEVTYRSCLWNKDEDRDNMRINFVMADGMVRRV